MTECSMFSPGFGLCSFLSSWRWICLNFDVQKSNDWMRLNYYYWRTRPEPAIIDLAIVLMPFKIKTHFTHQSNRMFICYCIWKKKRRLFIRCVFGFSRRTAKKKKQKKNKHLNRVEKCVFVKWKNNWTLYHTQKLQREREKERENLYLGRRKHLSACRVFVNIEYMIRPTLKCVRRVEKKTRE